ncbi:DUF2857 domain-containing protein [Shinella sp. BYT-45]|uniref:DUF2857 domain-containing protein n=1 Tax=Shinella sp. BYT-45 TaxID=3377377 RepID=UPI003980D063
MSGPHPLNQAVIAQALHDLRNGQLRKAKAMGFQNEDLEALKHPAMASILANTNISWCSVTINRNVLRRLFRQMDDLFREIGEIDRLLRLEASTSLVSRFYGLSHQEVAVRCAALGMPKRRGRHHVLTEQQDAALWEAWSATIKEQGIPLHDDTAMLAVAADLAEAMSLPLSVIWRAIRGWIREGLT